MMLASLIFSGAAITAKAGTINYVDWSSDNLGAGDVYGTLPGGINVTYSGEINFDQLNDAGTYWYTNASRVPGSGSEYTNNAVISNTPSTTDMIAINGNGTTDTFTFSSPVTDPVMLLVSLGDDFGYPTTYTFNTNISILSDGPGWWGGPGILNPIGTNAVQGIEGDGSIEFVGTYSSISFSTAYGESWNGFTIGVPAGVPVGVPDTASTLTLLASGLLALSFWKTSRKAAGSQT